jgi:hypothetical protein
MWLVPLLVLAWITKINSNKWNIGAMFATCVFSSLPLWPYGTKTSCKILMQWIPEGWRSWKVSRLRVSGSGVSGPCWLMRPQQNLSDLHYERLTWTLLSTKRKRTKQGNKGCKLRNLVMVFWESAREASIYRQVKGGRYDRTCPSGRATKNWEVASVYD